jgi:hypothetical protein
MMMKTAFADDGSRECSSNKIFDSKGADLTGSFASPPGEREPRGNHPAPCGPVATATSARGEALAAIIARVPSTRGRLAAGRVLIPLVVLQLVKHRAVPLGALISDLV